MGRHAENGRTLRALSSVRVRAFLALGIVLGFGSVSTMAYWTDSATVTGGTFTSGTLDIKVGSPPVDNNPAGFTTNFSMANMVPGSTKDAVLMVNNAGTVPFTFNIQGVATNNGGGADQMGSVLRLAVYRTSAGGACTGTPIDSGLVPTGQILPEQQLLAPGNRELCFRATLPSSADAALQGKSSVITLTLNANQIGAL